MIFKLAKKYGVEGVEGWGAVIASAAPIPMVIAFAVLLFLGACELSEKPEVRSYQTIGSACIAATGAVETLTPFKARGRLTRVQIAIIDDAVDIIDPICGSADIPGYESALRNLNSQIFKLEDIIRQLAGG